MRGLTTKKKSTERQALKTNYSSDGKQGTNTRGDCKGYAHARALLYSPCYFVQFLHTHTGSWKKKEKEKRDISCFSWHAHYDITCKSISMEHNTSTAGTTRNRCTTSPPNTLLNAKCSKILPQDTVRKIEGTTIDRPRISLLSTSCMWSSGRDPGHSALRNELGGYGAHIVCAPAV